MCWVGGCVTARKAASILALSWERDTRSAPENAVILRANAKLGCLREEEWVTLARRSA